LAKKKTASKKKASIIPEFDKLRFRYEYGGDTVQDLCAEYGYLIKDLKKYIKDRKWAVCNDPDLDEADDVNEFYSNIRRNLTVLISKRSISIWDRLKEIEDKLLAETLAEIERIRDRANPNPLLSDEDSDDLSVNITLEGSVSLELQRLTKILTTLQTSSQLYNEAVLVPSITDRDLKSLLKDTGPVGLKALMDMLETRGIPLPDIPLEDVE